MKNQQNKNPTAFGRTTATLNNEAVIDLQKFTAIADMPGDCEPWASLKELYSSDSFIDRATACILNGVESSRKNPFALSSRLLDRYFQADPNINYKVSGSRYKMLINQLLAVSTKAGTLRCIQPPKKGTSGQSNIAGRYEVSSPAVLATMPWISSSQGCSQGTSQPMLQSRVELSGAQQSTVELNTKTSLTTEVVSVNADLIGSASCDFRKPLEIHYCHTVAEALAEYYEALLENDKVGLRLERAHNAKRIFFPDYTFEIAWNDVVVKEPKNPADF